MTGSGRLRGLGVSSAYRSRGPARARASREARHEYHAVLVRHGLARTAQVAKGLGASGFGEVEDAREVNDSARAGVFVVDAYGKTMVAIGRD